VARLVVFFSVVALAVAGALFVISGRAAITRTGYRVARLESEHRQLVDGNRKLEAEVARLKTPAALQERIEGLGLDIVPPEERLEKDFASKEERRGDAR
jgi:hypothetical protein